MEFIADLHIHSSFSRATSKHMDLESLYVWAQLKGIEVVSTGDFTHPRWYAQLQEKLEPAEPGLYRLKDSYARAADEQVPETCRAAVRFVLGVEISTIYKKNDRTRKVHSLILAPNLLAAGRLNAALQEIGNIASDGRPILGLDCKRLLEIALDADSDNVLIPAHIWTPHFSVLGSASGFDSIDECFEELTPHIFALETGLSSDPPMNWCISMLDRFVLVSNSDAHSPSKLGREANIFTCEKDYYSMMQALREKDPAGFKGTIEFFPEEGKYHLDGHRACNQCLTPEQTRAAAGRCPECGAHVTVGVMHRVNELADRGADTRPAGSFPFQSLIPLVEILSEIYDVGPNSKKVQNAYMALLLQLGSEFTILRHCSPAELNRVGPPLLAEAITRLRAGKVAMQPGYDGVFGTITVFDPAEKKASQPSLF
jgi:uncharacterized protein (TIGR00375 family)